MAIVMPTVASMPTAAIPTPYKPAKWLETAITPQILNAGIATDCIPTDKPVIITVAGPVSPDLAICLTGAPAV